MPRHRADGQPAIPSLSTVTVRPDAGSPRLHLDIRPAQRAPVSARGRAGLGYRGCVRWSAGINRLLVVSTVGSVRA
jgi:hypothetical protein